MNTSYWPIQNSGSTTSLSTQLKAFYNKFLANLEATTEPRVWKSSTSGETLWNAYDPISQLTIDQASANELRTWLEELHYRH